MLHLCCASFLHYSTVITVIFRYYAVSMHVSNRDVRRSVAKSWGRNIREFHSTGALSPCRIGVILPMFITSTFLHLTLLIA